MKKKITLVMLLFLVFGATGIIQSHAAETNNIGFEFKIKANQGNTYSSARERSTKNPKCAWMVDFRKSTEGLKGQACKTRFWLEKTGIIGTQVSSDHDILEGSGRKFYPSTAKGVQCKVKLGAENNNYTVITYTASGYWDEETAVILK